MMSSNDNNNCTVLEKNSTKEIKRMISNVVRHAYYLWIQKSNVTHTQKWIGFTKLMRRDEIKKEKWRYMETVRF